MMSEIKDLLSWWMVPAAFFIAGYFVAARFDHDTSTQDFIFGIVLGGTIGMIIGHFI